MNLSAESVIYASSIYEVGKLVRERRQALKMRQADVAARAGLSRSRLVDLEKNKAVEGLSFHKLNSLLAVLGLQLAIGVSHEPSEVLAHNRNAILVPGNVKVRVPSIG
ncbi:MAG TPA: helix-turn-helix domain-containing protein [Gammaproteobacteria bacterium]|nr:helix-turn-helix domain-containing protein [Gammaproteobacteria bacterium]